jgi:hypothetical protein
MAALFCTIGAVVFFRFMLEVMRSNNSMRRDATSQKQPSWAIRPAAAGATLMLAFSETYWSQAVSVEVYSLHVFLLLVTVFAFFRAAHGGAAHWWFFFAFVVGLGFTNHMTFILLAPGLVYYYFASQGWSKGSWLRLLRFIPVSLLGLSVYAYLPLRAVHGPPLNWGNPVTWERLMWHLSGKQYRVWLFGSAEAAERQLSYFLRTLPIEFVYVGVLCAALGIVVMWRTHRRLLVATLLLFLACVLYAINYDIHDIDSYFLLAYITVSLWAAFGLRAIAEWLVGSVAWNRRVAGGMVVVAGVAVAVGNFDRVNQRGNYLVEDYTHNMLHGFREGALVLSYQWDFWVSASYYYQQVRGVRKDVAVVDKELLRRSWYFTQLERSYPWLVQGSRGEVDAFLKELYKFEHDLPYNPTVIETRFVAMIRSFVLRSMAHRDVYVTGEIEPEFTVGLQRVPEGLAFRLTADSLFHPSPRLRFQARPYERRGRLEDMTWRLYGSAFVARGDYYLAYGERAEALEAYKAAVRIDGESAVARGKAAYLESGR